MKNSNDGFHLGNLIKKHIYFRNKSVKEVAMHLDLNEKTFSDHLNKSKMLSDELFDIADYLELSLDYIGSMSKTKPGLLGQKVCRLNKTSHNKANELVSCEIEKIKSTDEKDVNYIITELKKTYNGLGYVIDALLPLDNSDTGVPYQIYVKDSRVRGNINSGEYVIWPPVGKELDIEDYEEFLNGQAGVDYVKSLLKGTVGKGKNRNKNIKDFKIDEIHKDYEQLSSEEILQFWDGRRVIRNKSGEIIACKQGGVGLREFIELEYSRAEYYYIQGMLNIDAGKYHEALVDFNTALFVYHTDMFVVEVYRCCGRRYFERFDVYETPVEFNGYNNVIGECDIYLNQIKILQKLGAYKNVIDSVCMMMNTEEYNECVKDVYGNFNEFIIEFKKILLDAYIKEKQFDEALRVCDELLEIVDFRSEFNMRLLKSLVLEQMGEYNAALVAIEEDFFSSEFLKEKVVTDEFMKEYQYEFTRINLQGNRLLQIMADKGIAIEVASFIDDEYEEC